MDDAKAYEQEIRFLEWERDEALLRAREAEEMVARQGIELCRLGEQLETSSGSCAHAQRWVRSLLEIILRCCQHPLGLIDQAVLVALHETMKQWKEETLDVNSP